MMNSGHVYFLLNPSMPGLMKIGFTTTTLGQRLAELETTGVPEPFIVGAAFLVSDARLCEERLHELFRAKRKDRNREFFELSLDEALSKAMPIVQEMVSSVASSGDSKAEDYRELTFEESQMLCMLVHEPRGHPVRAEDVAREHCVHVQKVLLGCARLIDMGLIRECRDRHYGTNTYSLTHTGRKYCFDHQIVISEIIEEA